MALFYLLLLPAQGLLSAILLPWPAPDLFLIAVLLLVRRLSPWQLIIVAYGIGLLQDLVGHGVLGLHGFGLAAAALGASLVRAQLSQSGLFERALIVSAALGGKWLALSAAIVWLSGSVDSLKSVVSVLPFDAGFTLVLGLWLLSWVEARFERASILRRELV